MIEANEKAAGVIGARSPVGHHLVRLLEAAGWKPVTFSRADLAAYNHAWTSHPIPHLISVAHIWAVAEHLAFLHTIGVRRLVAISSTSRFTKTASSDEAERALAQRLTASEDRVLAWAKENGVDCTILRPTLIYGGGGDRNISEVAAFIRKFGFFPLLGPANGLRQPIHVEDVAAACAAALHGQDLAAAYNISGGEVLPYREMVERVFKALGRQPRFVTVPRVAVDAGVSLVRLIPRFRAVSRGMADRMTSDMVFDHSDAARDFGFKARRFVLVPQDVGISCGLDGV